MKQLKTLSIKLLKNNNSFNMKNKKIFIIFFCLFLNLSEVLADERKDQLNKLFKELKIDNPVLTFEVEQKIWKIWSTHPKRNKLTLMLSEGSDLVKKDQLNEAVKVFTKVIELDPNWAEAWNKRATVLYLLGEFQKSQKDIDEVLKLEERHFGALAGQGLVNIQLKNYEKAIMSYKKAQKIYPSMKSPKFMIKEIEELIKKQSI